MDEKGLLFLDPSSAPKKSRGNISPDLKRAIWDLYIPGGAATKTAYCPLCGKGVIERNVNSGYEAAHIVADKFFPPGRKLSIYYLYPSCSSCNNLCQDLCILDFLYLYARYKLLQQMMENIYHIYVEEHPNLSLKDRLIWNVLHHLYGGEQFSAGGGLINQKPIFEMAKSVQLRHYTLQVEEASDKLRKLSGELYEVAMSEIIVSAPRFS